MTLVIGAVMVVLGGVLLAGRELTLLLPKPARGAPSTRIVSMAGYGVAFAIASLSCTIGPFLAAAGIALRGGDIGSGLATFLAYALGMGLVVAVLAVAAALASTAVATGIRRVLPYVPTIGGALLVVTGAYVGYYGYYELQLFHGGGSAATRSSTRPARSSPRWSAGSTRSARAVLAAARRAPRGRALLARRVRHR